MTKKLHNCIKGVESIQQSAQNNFDAREKKRNIQKKLFKQHSDHPTVPGTLLDDINTMCKFGAKNTNKSVPDTFKKNKDKFGRQMDRRIKDVKRATRNAADGGFWNDAWNLVKSSFNWIPTTGKASFTKDFGEKLKGIEGKSNAEKAAELQQFASKNRGKWMANVDFHLPYGQASYQNELWKKLRDADNTKKGKEDNFIENYIGHKGCLTKNLSDEGMKSILKKNFRTDDTLWRTQWDDKYYEKDEECLADLSDVRAQTIIKAAEDYGQSLGITKSESDPAVVLQDMANELETCKANWLNSNRLKKKST